MDPISIIVTALVTGAAAALKPTTEQAIKDAYASVKGLIQRRFGRVDVAVLETDPASKARQAVVQEDLEKAGAGQDEELLSKAKALLDAIQAHASDMPEKVGLDLEEIKGASLSAERILAEGSHATGVKVKGADIKGDITFRDVTARSGEETPPKKSLEPTAGGAQVPTAVQLTGVSAGGNVSINSTVEQFVTKISEKQYVDSRTITQNVIVFGPELMEQIAKKLVELQGLNKPIIQILSEEPVPEQHISRQITEMIAAQREVVAKDVPTTPQASYYLGMLAAYNREYDAALEYFRQAVHADPEFTDAYEAIAWLQQYRATESLTMGQYDQAASCLAEAHEAGIHTDPVNPDALALRGYIAKTQAQVAENQHQLAERDRYYGEAARMFEYAAKLDPDNPSVQNGLGNVQHAQGNLDAAITAYSRAIELAPNYTAAHHDLALAYEGKMYADPENAAKWRYKALESWQETYELAPQDPGFSADYILFIGQRIQQLKTLTGLDSVKPRSGRHRDRRQN